MQTDWGRPAVGHVPKHTPTGPMSLIHIRILLSPPSSRNMKEWHRSPMVGVLPLLKNTSQIKLEISSSFSCFINIWCLMFRVGWIRSCPIPSHLALIRVHSEPQNVTFFFKESFQMWLLKVSSYGIRVHPKSSDWVLTSRGEEKTAIKTQKKEVQATIEAQIGVKQRQAKEVQDLLAITIC